MSYTHLDGYALLLAPGCRYYLAQELSGLSHLGVTWELDLSSDFDSGLVMVKCMVHAAGKDLGYGFTIDPKYHAHIVDYAHHNIKTIANMIKAEIHDMVVQGSFAKLMYPGKIFDIDDVETSFVPYKPNGDYPLLHVGNGVMIPDYLRDEYSNSPPIEDND